MCTKLDQREKEQRARRWGKMRGSLRESKPKIKWPTEYQCKEFRKKGSCIFYFFAVVLPSGSIHRHARRTRRPHIWFGVYRVVGSPRAAICLGPDRIAPLLFALPHYLLYVPATNFVHVAFIYCCRPYGSQRALSSRSRTEVWKLDAQTTAQCSTFFPRKKKLTQVSHRGHSTAAIFCILAVGPSSE